MRILLVRPAVPRHTIGLKHIMICEPLELEYVAAGLEGHEVQVMDLMRPASAGWAEIMPTAGRASCASWVIRCPLGAGSDSTRTTAMPTAANIPRATKNTLLRLSKANIGHPHKPCAPASLCAIFAAVQRTR